MDRFWQMQAFVAVVEAGSFVNAGEQLRSSKAAVSRAVLDLEGRLGARLLHRTTRRLSLTEAGRDYFERCRMILAEAEEADTIASSSTGRAVGQIKVNVPQSFGVLHLAPLWGAFLDANPAVSLEVTLSDRLVDLVEEGYDLAIRISRLADSTLISRRLTSCELVMCASPEYLASHGAPQTLADLVQHKIVAYSYLAAGDHWSFDSPAGPVSVTTQPRLRANNGDTCRIAALAHQGIILQPTFIVGPDLDAGKLVRVLPECRAPQLGIYAVYPSRRHLSGKVRALVDFLAAQFAEHDRWR